MCHFPTCTRHRSSTASVQWFSRVRKKGEERFTFAALPAQHHIRTTAHLAGRRKDNFSKKKRKKGKNHFSPSSYSLFAYAQLGHEDKCFLGSPRPTSQLSRAIPSTIESFSSSWFSSSSFFRHPCLLRLLPFKELNGAPVCEQRQLSPLSVLPISEYYVFSTTSAYVEDIPHPFDLLRKHHCAVLLRTPQSNKKKRHQMRGQWERGGENTKVDGTIHTRLLTCPHTLTFTQGSAIISSTTTLLYEHTTTTTTYRQVFLCVLPWKKNLARFWMTWKQELFTYLSLLCQLKIKRTSTNICQASYFKLFKKYLDSINESRRQSGVAES